MAVTLDLRVEGEAWAELAELESLCLKALEAGAIAEDCHGEVSVLLTDDAEMQALNAKWRSKDTPTDVLSFPAGEHEPGFLGDIAVGYETSAADADRHGKSMADHLAHLLIHGLLHLAGHDHMEDTQAAKMQALEITALASLGIPDPYSGELKMRK